MQTVRLLKRYGLLELHKQCACGHGRFARAPYGGAHGIGPPVVRGGRAPAASVLAASAAAAGAATRNRRDVRWPRRRRR